LAPKTDTFPNAIWATSRTHAILFSAFCSASVRATYGHARHFASPIPDQSRQNRPDRSKKQKNPFSPSMTAQNFIQTASRSQFA
jgi:hypothetical protein